jgi:tRNA nucleotidyltransferase/poly(A) polymerase
VVDAKGARAVVNAPARLTGTPSLDPPPAVRRIAARLADAGFETWCVGGAVRDALLGQSHADWDLATAAIPTEVQSLFDRTVPHGIEFGTVGVLDRAGIMHEVTTFRRDVRHDGRHAVVEYGVSLDEDLARRDFTINAIAFSPASGEIRDPFGGRQDLEQGIVRAVGDPRARMVEDRLRALRAFRFAGRFGFAIEPETWKAIVESAPFLPRLSRERVRQEIEKTMDQVVRPSRSFELWRRSGAFQSLIPSLARVPDVAFVAADFIGMPDATSRPERAQARARNRLATLFLDLSADETRATLEDLRASNRQTDWVTHQVECWHALGGSLRAAAAAGNATDAAIRRAAATIGRTYFADFMRVAVSRWSAEGETKLPAVASAYRRGTRIAFRDPLAVGDLAIDGSDLMELGIPAGPAIGSLLRRLLEVVIEDPSKNHREVLFSLAKEAGRGGVGG